MYVEISRIRKQEKGDDGEQFVCAVQKENNISWIWSCVFHVWLVALREFPCALHIIFRRMLCALHQFLKSLSEHFFWALLPTCKPYDNPAWYRISKQTIRRFWKPHWTIPGVLSLSLIRKAPSIDCSRSISSALARVILP